MTDKQVIDFDPDTYIDIKWIQLIKEMIAMVDQPDWWVVRLHILCHLKTRVG